LIITEVKNAHSFVCKRAEFVHQRLRDFIKMTLTWVSSHWSKLASSRVILWKTWLKSSPIHQKSSLTWVTLSLLKS